MELNYKNTNLFHKYLWNKVDLELFKTHLHNSLDNIYLYDGYINEKWDQFQKSPIQFAVSFEPAFFNACFAHMHEIDYKG